MNSEVSSLPRGGVREDLNRRIQNVTALDTTLVCVVRTVDPRDVGVERPRTSKEDIQCRSYDERSLRGTEGSDLIHRGTPGDVGGVKRIGGGEVNGKNGHRKNGLTRGDGSDGSGLRSRLMKTFGVKGIDILQSSYRGWSVSVIFFLIP